MARLRTLKPSFFTNDVLAEVEPLGRLLFQGLWCIADREGRLEDRPRRIKAEVLPYDDVDVDDLLDELAGKGFIIRYKAAGNRYIQVVNFGKHQTPHIKEAPSTIPAPEEHHTSTVLDTDDNQASTPSSGEWDPVMGSSSGNLGVGSGEGAAAADAAPPSPPVPLHPVSDLAKETADVLIGAPWVGDELVDVATAVERSFALVPDFKPRDGPLLAEQYTHWKGYRKKPPSNWYAAWLNWLKKERKDDEGQRERGHANGRAATDSGIPAGGLYADPRVQAPAVTGIRRRIGAG